MRELVVRVKHGVSVVVFEAEQDNPNTLPEGMGVSDYVHDLLERGVRHIEINVETREN